MTEIGITNQDYSVEMSFTGITRERAARALGRLFGTEPEHSGGTFDTWTVKDQDSRTWRLFYDPVVRGEWRIGNVPLREAATVPPRGQETAQAEQSFYPGNITADTLHYLPSRAHAYRVRLASPMLSYGDMGRIRECTDALKAEGAKVNDTCALSVHVDASNHNRQSLKNLVGIMYSKEDILFRAV